MIKLLNAENRIVVATSKWSYIENSGFDLYNSRESTGVMTSLNQSWENLAVSHCLKEPFVSNYCNSKSIFTHEILTMLG